MTQNNGLKKPRRNEMKITVTVNVPELDVCEYSESEPCWYINEVDPYCNLFQGMLAVSCNNKNMKCIACTMHSMRNDRNQA